jgi:hypothetical protein
MPISVSQSFSEDSNAPRFQPADDDFHADRIHPLVELEYRIFGLPNDLHAGDAPIFQWLKLRTLGQPIV